MEFHNRLYNLRKQKGLSQEELANRLNVSRQTISKWEVGDSTPDMEKLIAISDMFEVSLDELVMGKESIPKDEKNSKLEMVSGIKDIIVTDVNKKKIKKWFKAAGIIIGIIVLIDIISMIIYVGLNGFPQ